MNPVPIPATVHPAFEKLVGATVPAVRRIDATSAARAISRRAAGGLDSSQGAPRWGA